MDKEEILEKSRKENKNQDLYEKQISTEAANWGAILALFIATVLFVVQIFVGKGINYGLYAIVFSVNGGGYLYKAIKLKDKKEMVLAIITLVVVAAFTGAYMYQLIHG